MWRSAVLSHTLWFGAAERDGRGGATGCGGVLRGVRRMGDEESFPVTLRVYDLSLGMAKTMSMQVRGGKGREQACDCAGAAFCVRAARGWGSRGCAWGLVAAPRSS
eukprot:COSAG02_NODE_477_length_21523_cov_11.763163_3_plen_106_part_00